MSDDIYNSNHKVLVVDDDEGILFLLKEYLEDDGFEVVTANTLQGAIREVTGAAFSLILTDLNYLSHNDKSGLELIRIARSSGGVNQRTPIIVLTGNPNALTDDDQILIGGTGICLATKPIVPSEIVCIIQESLSVRPESY